MVSTIASEDGARKTKRHAPSFEKLPGHSAWVRAGHSPKPDPKSHPGGFGRNFSEEGALLLMRVWSGAADATTQGRTAQQGNKGRGKPGDTLERDKCLSAVCEHLEPAVPEGHTTLHVSPCVS